ncbi:MAG: hypothetical protein LBO03_08725 [Acidaminococcales bacterium]|nr:hypothetical protein [Acidaminococcales bacterium]
MSIRPVDMQVILPHTTDVGKFQAVQNDQAAASQQLFAEKLQKEAILRQEQVQETQRGEFSKVNRDKEKEQKEGKKKKNSLKSPERAPTDKDNEAPDGGGKKAKVSLDPLVGKNLDIIS